MHIDGFDMGGRHIGCAHYGLSLGWTVRIGPAKHQVKLIEDARRILRDAGAVTLKESDGRKY